MHDSFKFSLNISKFWSKIGHNTTICLISVPNLKEINKGEGFFWLKGIVLNRCEEEEE